MWKFLLYLACLVRHSNATDVDHNYRNLLAIDRVERTLIVRESKVSTLSLSLLSAKPISMQ